MQTFLHLDTFHDSSLRKLTVEHLFIMSTESALEGGYRQVENPQPGIQEDA